MRNLNPTPSRPSRWFLRTARSAKRPIRGRLRRLFRSLLLENLEDRRLMVRQVAGFIQSPDVWSGTIQVTGDVAVTTQLTIEPGTVIKVNQGQVINIRSDGSLNAVGTSQSPIIFTSTQDDSVGEDLTGEAVGAPLRGHWHQLILDTGNATLDQFEVRYAGNDVSPNNSFQPYSSPSILVTGTPVLRNGLVRDGDWTGIEVRANATFDNIRVENVDASAFHQRNNLSPTYSRLSASDNGGNHVFVEAAQIPGTQTWSFGGLPAHLSGDLFVDGELNLAPGTVIKVPQGAYVQARSGGAIKALGTSQAPIVFTSIHDDTIGGDSNGNGNSTVPLPGHWESLYVDSSATVLQNVEVRYAGNASDPGNTFGPYRISAVHSRSGATPTFTNLRIRDSENVGMYIQDSSPRLEGVTIERSGQRALQQTLSSLPNYVSLALSNNAFNHIGLEGGNVTSDRSWDFLGLPVVVLGTALAVKPDATLTLAPGTIFKFQTGAYFSIEGQLTAPGTSARPIIFTSDEDDSIGGDSNGDGSATTAGPGQWESLYISGQGTALEHVEVRYAGNVSDPGNTFGPYRVPAVQIADALSPTLRNVRVFASENVGIAANGSSSPEFTNLRVENSGREAIQQALSSMPVYAGVVLRENQGNRITWSGGTLNGTRTMDFQGIPVHLTTNLTIGANTTLTFVPGTILKMPEGAYIDSAPTGVLIAEGTPEKPIVFTSIHDDTVGGDSNNNLDSTLPGPGQWESIYLYNSDTSFNHVEIRYAGNVSNPGNTFGPYRVAGLHVSNQSSPTIRNTRIRHAENQGLAILDKTGPILDGLRVENSGQEAIYQVLSSTATYSGVQLLDNLADRVTLTGGTIATSRTLDFNRLPVYVTDNLAIGADASVTIVPGSTFKFRQGDYFLVSGSLDAQGTAEAPIIFTSINDDSAGGDSDGDGTATPPQAGQWQGFYIDSSTTTLDHVHIRYAGNDSNSGNSFGPYRVAAFNIRNGSQPQIHNTRVSYAENIGLSIQGGSKPLLDNLTIEYSGHYNASGREAIEQDLASDPTYQGIHLIGNYADRITLQGGTISGTRTLDFDYIPVFVNNNLQFAPDSNVTIVPGTIFKFAEGDSLWSRGTLTANGTAEAPIILG